MDAAFLCIPLALGTFAAWLGSQAPRKRLARYGVLVVSGCFLALSGLCAWDRHRLQNSDRYYELRCGTPGIYAITLEPCYMPGINVRLVNKENRSVDPYFSSARLSEFKWGLRTVLATHTYLPDSVPGGSHALFDVSVAGKPSVLEYVVTERTAPLLEGALLHVRNDVSHWEDAAIGDYLDRLMIVPLAIVALAGPAMWVAMSIARRRPPRGISTSPGGVNG